MHLPWDWRSVSHIIRSLVSLGPSLRQSADFLKQEPQTTQNKALYLSLSLINLFQKYLCIPVVTISSFVYSFYFIIIQNINL